MGFRKNLASVDIAEAPPGSPRSPRSETSVQSVVSSMSELSLQTNSIESQNSLSSQRSSLYSQGSLTSQTSSLFSQTSLQSQRSLQSQFSFQSQVSVQSQVSLTSQASLQSEISLCSHSSLLPSLRSLVTDGKANDSAEFRCVTTLNGHDGHVSSLALSNDFLYSGSSSDDIRVWSQSELTEYCKFGSGDGAVKALVVAGERVFSAHQDHKIRIWKRSRQQPSVHKLVGTMPTVKDYLITFIPPKNYVQIRRHKKSLWIEHVDTISVLAMGKNDVLYSGSWDKTVKVWRLSDFRCLESYKAHEDAINALVVSDDGFVYTGSADAKVKVWAKLTGEKKHSLVTTLESHKSAVNALAMSPDGSILYSGACDRAVIVWEREDSAQHMVVAGLLRGHRQAVLCLSSVGDFLCSGSADKTIRVWKREVGTMHSCLAILQGHGGPVKSLSVMMNTMTDFTVYSGSIDRDIRVWRVSCPTESASSQEEIMEMGI